MRNPHPSVTPSDLGEHPELAVLEVLRTALDMARFAIIAAHPELTEADPAAGPSSLEELAADHILNAVDSLQRAAASYRQTIKTDARRAKLSRQDVYDYPF